MANGTLGKGATLKINNNLVGGLKEIQIPEISIDMVDITSHSTVSNFKEKIAGLYDVGDISFTCNFIKSDVGQAYVRSNFGDETTFEIELSNGVKWTGPCVVGGHGGTAPVDKEITFTFKLHVTGEVTVTEA